ncbi:hypothetical protein BHE74_00009064 [Ensete ventricosum]|nr:hypothetical protein BHE74_00009064 [Ensete ventricosum]
MPLPCRRHLLPLLSSLLHQITSSATCSQMPSRSLLCHYHFYHYSHQCCPLLLLAMSLWVTVTIACSHAAADHCCPFLLSP